MGRTLPPFTGFDEIATNLGEVQNKGVELTLNSQNMAMKTSSGTPVSALLT